MGCTQRCVDVNAPFVSCGNTCSHMGSDGVDTVYIYIYVYIYICICVHMHMYMSCTDVSLTLYGVSIVISITFGCKAVPMSAPASLGLISAFCRSYRIWVRSRGPENLMSRSLGTPIAPTVRARKSPSLLVGASSTWAACGSLSFGQSWRS